MTPPTVTQQDRDAAADLLDEISSLTGDDGIGQVADLIRDGEYDEHDAVQAFARHREQARADAVREIAEWVRKLNPHASPSWIARQIERGAYHAA